MNSHSAPEYHYHGLATTQTQSQQYDDESDFGSQKENVKSSREALPGNQGAAQSSSKPLVVDKTSRLPPKSTTNTKTVSFQSPKAVPTPSKLEGRSTARSLRRATPPRKRDLSRDSFGEDFDDPAEKFIASSKQFDIPLAQLGRVTSPSVEGSPRPTTTKTMYTDDDILLDEERLKVPEKVLVPDSDCDNSQSQPRSQSLSQPHSQSQDMEYEDYAAEAHQPEDDHSIILPAVPGSQESTQYGSSIGGPTSSEKAMYGSQALEATQILEPTQIIGEPTQILEATQPVNNSIDSPDYSTATAGRGEVASGNTGGQPKTLFDSLAAHKRDRYLNHLGHIPQYDPPGTDNTAYSTRAAPPGLLTLQDTQPAFEEALAPPPRLLGNPIGAPSRLRHTVVDEKTEIIPDSEPPREDSSPLKSPKRPPTSRQRPASSDTETDNEVIPMAVDGEKKDEAPSALSANISRRDAEEEEDKEEEEEAEVPLSTTSSKRKGQPDLKGKGKAVEMGPPLPKTITTRVASAKPNPPKRQKRRDDSPDVPSSVPHQDHPPAVAPVKAQAKGRSRTKSALTTRARKKPAKKMPKRSAAKNAEDSDDGMLSPNSEEETDPADDDEYTAAGSSTRKRKRAIKAESPVVQYQPRGRRGTGKASASTRQLTRGRATSTSTHAGSEPTRVFALWRRDGHFYSGVLHSFIAAQMKYRVHFDDGTEDDVSINQMRLCAPRVGDTGFIQGQTRPVMIVGLLDDGQISVERDRVSSTVPVSSLRIAARTINSLWGDRVLDTETIVCIVRPPRSIATPTPSRLSSVSGGFSRRCSDLFAKIGFCITYVTEAGGEKEAIAAQIKNNGGVVINNWEEVILMKGKRTKTRWTLNQKDATTAFRGVQYVFLLSDDASYTSKYLMALALGVPCLRFDYIDRALETNDLTVWTSHLLLAGFSDLYSCRVSQTINADWDTLLDMTGIMNDPVSFKPFAEKAVLYAGTQAAAVIPRIILAMGAESVETVSDVKHASCPLAEYDYIVVFAAKERQLRGCTVSTVVSWDWVKDALISRSIPPIN
ncbi:hypothetical protein DFH07DRAFT_767201 [Mycena maculata]|uniref:BRCT domain-containing protein n=1 Tax=Mycena maculata TaxID=230809 RepID=A0AAD7NSW6_9AGAR|nr:hypothetical protein DFH07DRAFT_767201 [Mycena maculata]